MQRHRPTPRVLYLDGEIVSHTRPDDAAVTRTCLSSCISQSHRKCAEGFSSNFHSRYARSCNLTFLFLIIIIIIIISLANESTDRIFYLLVQRIILLMVPSAMGILLQFVCDNKIILVSIRRIDFSSCCRK